MKHSKKTRKPADLKGELRAAEVCLLFLPEVVWFDDERHTDLSWEKLLQGLQQRLDQLPLRAPHVDDDGETPFTDVLADRRDRMEDDRQEGKRGTTGKDNGEVQTKS